MATSREALTRTTIRNHRKSVVCIVIHESDRTLAGSGFIVRVAAMDRRALVITCYHVAALFVPGTGKLGIRVPDLGHELECEILYLDRNKDLAIIGVSGMPDGYPALIFSSETTLTIGSDAVLLAYYPPDSLAGSNNPIPMEPAASAGAIVGPAIRETKELDWAERLRHQCTSMSGCSGGAVIANGRVIGVHNSGNVQLGYATNFVTVMAAVRNWVGLQDGNRADLTLEELFQMLRP